MMKRKILFVVNSILNGGLETMLINVIQSLTETCDVEVLSIYDADSFCSKKIKQLITYSTLDIYRNTFNHSILRSIYSRSFDKPMLQRFIFKSFLRKHHFDIVVAFSEGLALSLVAKTKIPFVEKKLWIHTDFLNNDVWIKSNKKRLKHLFSKFSDVIFVCEPLRRKFSAILSLKSTSCINNCVDIRKISQLANEQNDLGQEKLIEFISIGRLEIEKGHDRIINSIAKLTELERNKMHLTIVGDGGMANHLKRTVTELGLKKQVSFVDATPNPYPFIKRADVLFLASRYEGFGLVLIEAMALGVPCIATDTTGAKAVLEDGKYGLLIKNVDSNILSTLKAVISDISQLDKYKSIMFNRAEEFSIETFSKKVNEYFMSSQSI